MAVAVEDVRRIVTEAGRIALAHYRKVTGSVERVGGVLAYASGRPVVLGELIGRDKVPEALYAGSPETVELLRRRIVPRGA